MVNNNFLLLLSAAFCADYGLCCAFTLCLCVAVLPVIVFSIYQSVVAMDMQSEKEIDKWYNNTALYYYLITYGAIILIMMFWCCCVYKKIKSSTKHDIVDTPC